MAKRPHMQSLAREFPDLAQQWHPTKNGALTPRDVSRGSDRKVWWICPVDASHVWDASISNRVKPSGCPFCAGKRPTIRTCLAAVSPGLASQWHPTANGVLTPHDVLPNSNNKFWWKCPRDSSHEWEATANNRSNGRGCPICAGKRVIPTTSLEVLYPALANEWHPKLNNSLLPSDLRPASNVDVWWRCHTNSEHVWRTTPNKRTAGQGCPYCAGKAVIYSNSLAALNPILAHEWNHDRNHFGPDSIRPGSDKIVWWRCSDEPSHEWPARVANRTVQGTGCPFCSGLLATPETSLAHHYPDLAKEWHQKLNEDITPFDVRPQSNKRRWWQCQRNPLHEWSTSVQSRVLGTGCPQCSHRLAAVETCLASISPDLASEWHPTKNGDLTPMDVLPHSTRSVWWRCAVNPAHEWDAVVAWRSRGISCCPQCKSLAVLIPDLANEWHQARNGSLTPETITPGSGQKVWWQCRHDPSHEWEAVVASRSIGNGCPMCAGKVATPETSLAAICPEVAAEWHPLKNESFTPHQVTRASGKKVWWQCSRDPRHEWIAAVHHRTRGVGCPFCRLVPRSRNELYLAWELKLFFDFDIEEHKVKCGNRIVDVDIFIPAHDLIVEFDGSYWHADSEERDAHKTLTLEESGYHVIRIREEPLTPIGSLDAVVKPQDYKGSANAALLMIESLLGSKLPGVADYLNESTLMNSCKADLHIERLLNEKAKRKAASE